MGRAVCRGTRGGIWTKSGEKLTLQNRTTGNRDKKLRVHKEYYS
jgi:hypothetical protein